MLASRQSTVSVRASSQKAAAAAPKPVVKAQAPRFLPAAAAAFAAVTLMVGPAFADTNVSRRKTEMSARHLFRSLQIGRQAAGTQVVAGDRAYVFPFIKLVRAFGA
jgi:hypothetical protein